MSWYKCLWFRNANCSVMTITDSHRREKKDKIFVQNFLQYSFLFFCFQPCPKCPFETHIVSTFSSSDILYPNFLYYKQFMLVFHDAKPFWWVQPVGSESFQCPNGQTQDNDNGQITSTSYAFQSNLLVWCLLINKRNSHWSASEHRAVGWFFPLQNVLRY